MSGESILIEQLRAEVDRLELGLAAVAMCDSSDCGMCVSCLVKRAEKAERERDEARANYAFMVERAADQKLDGYRELGARAAAAEERAERAERERDEARAERDAYKRAKEENDERFMRERDDARAERDRRPDISPEDARMMEDARATLELPAYEHGPEHQEAAIRIASAIRAHAAKSVKP